MARASKTSVPQIDLSSLSESQLNIYQRLRRLEGQMRGLQRMVHEKRDCVEILTQVIAARAALDRVGLAILQGKINDCFPELNETDNMDVNKLQRALELWLHGGSG